MTQYSKDFLEKLGPGYADKNLDSLLYILINKAYPATEAIQECTVEYDMFYLGYDENPEYYISLADLVFFAEKVESNTINIFIELHGSKNGFIEYLNYLKCVVTPDSLDLPDLE